MLYYEPVNGYDNLGDNILCEKENPMERIIFACSRDKFTTIFTTSLLLTIVAASIVAYLPLMKSSAAVIATIILAANLLLIAGVVAYLPIRYEITEDSVVVKRLGPNVIIALGDITGVSGDTGDMLKGSIRIGANGGLGGYVGLFSNKKLGRYRAYMTRRDKVVLIETDAAKYVLSPDDPGRFMEILRERSAVE